METCFSLRTKGERGASSRGNEKRDPSGVGEDREQEAAQFTSKYMGLRSLSQPSQARLVVCCRKEEGALQTAGGRRKWHSQLCRLGAVLLLLLLLGEGLRKQ